MNAMSRNDLIDSLREPRAVAKRNWGNITDLNTGAAAHQQTPKYKEELAHVPVRIDTLRRLGAVYYADRSLCSEVDRLLRLPLLKGWPSGPAFRGSPLNEVPSVMEAGQSASRGRSLIASWPPTEMVTSTRLRSPSGRASDGCIFCRTNGERRCFYMSHTLREDSGPGSKGRVTCPVLRSYQCPQCGYPGGDEAHTLRYCPLNKDLNTRSVYKTPRKSNGEPRRRPCSPARSRRHGSVGTRSPATSVSGCDSYKPSQPRMRPASVFNRRVDSYEPSQPRMRPASVSNRRVDSYEPSQPQMRPASVSNRRVDSYELSQPRMRPAPVSNCRVDSYELSQPRVRPVGPPRRQISLTDKVGMRRSGVEFQR